MSEHGVVAALLLSLVKKHYVPQTHGGSVQHGGITRSVRTGQRHRGRRTQQSIRKTDTSPVVDDFECISNHRVY